MPEKLEIFACKYCGREWPEYGHAVNCENSHLHVADMEIGHIEKPGNEDFCYDQQTRWPSFIYIRCKSKSIDGAVYQLVSRARRSRSIAKV